MTDARALLLTSEGFKRAMIYVLTRGNLQYYGLHLIASIRRHHSRKAHRHPEFTDKTIWDVFEVERSKLVPYAGR